ncbi:MAG TPA: hypothetical protein PK948_02220 [Gemmatimonadales bacterium]|nr:hypothetical protein [Gemmatimonadales bacterium]
MTFARRLFAVAGIYGLVSLLPMFFLERRLMERLPPALTHPEFYYGFVGVALAWQLLFLLVAREPVRLRPVMLPAVVEKLGWGIGVLVLVAQGRIGTFFVPAALIDLLLATLFVVAWRRLDGFPLPAEGDKLRGSARTQP